MNVTCATFKVKAHYFVMQGSSNDLSFLVGSKLMHIYGNFDGFPEKKVHCLGS